MPVFGDEDRMRLLAFLMQAMDDDNASDMDGFAMNFLHNGKVWDMLAEHFPAASPSAVKAVMLEAYEKRKNL